MMPLIGVRELRERTAEVLRKVRKEQSEGRRAETTAGEYPGRTRCPAAVDPRQSIQGRIVTNTQP